MFTYEKSLLINRPQQEVFDFVSNPANNPQWQSTTEAAEWTSEGPPGVGSTFRSVVKFLGRSIDNTNEITIWHPPQQFGFTSVSGPFPLEVTMKFEPQESGTQLTVDLQAEFGGFFKLAEGMVGKQAVKLLSTNLGALKLLLEEGQA